MCSPQESCSLWIQRLVWVQTSRNIHFMECDNMSGTGVTFFAAWIHRWRERARGKVTNPYHHYKGWQAPITNWPPTQSNLGCLDQQTLSTADRSILHKIRSNIIKEVALDSFWLAHLGRISAALPCSSLRSCRKGVIKGKDRSCNGCDSEWKDLFK